MVEKALRLCEGSLGTLRIYDGETFHLAAIVQGEALALPDAGQGPEPPTAGVGKRLKSFTLPRKEVGPGVLWGEQPGPNLAT